MMSIYSFEFQVSVASIGRFETIKTRKQNKNKRNQVNNV
jgi:hypothetical protein